jgi:hypothetical protein
MLEQKCNSTHSKSFDALVSTKQLIYFQFLHLRGENRECILNLNFWVTSELFNPFLIASC